MYKGFSDAKNKRQLLEHYLKTIGNFTIQKGIYTIEISSPHSFNSQIFNSNR